MALSKKEQEHLDAKKAKAEEAKEARAEAKAEAEAQSEDQPVLLGDPKPGSPGGPPVDEADNAPTEGPPEDKGEAVFGADSHPTAGVEASQAQVVVEDEEAPEKSKHHDVPVSTAGVRTAEAIPDGPKRAMFEADLRVQTLRTQLAAARSAAQQGSERTDIPELETALAEAEEKAAKEHKAFDEKQAKAAKKKK